jgi:hypothetical protein
MMEPAQPAGAEHRSLAMPFWLRLKDGAKAECSRLSQAVAH